MEGTVAEEAVVERSKNEKWQQKKWLTKSSKLIKLQLNDEEMRTYG